MTRASSESYVFCATSISPFRLRFQLAPKLAGTRPVFTFVRLGKVGIAHRHPDIAVSEQLRKPVEIISRHYVLGYLGVAQVVEKKVSNLCSLEKFMEALVRTLAPTGGDRSMNRDSPTSSLGIG